MNKKGAASTAAVIEISTNNISMRVAQLSKGEIHTLDYLKYPVSLDHDVFETGTISFNSLRQLSGALDKFSEALLSYGVEKPRVVSATALLEAKNRSLVVDQLKVRNNLDVSVLDGSQEKAYIFSELKKCLAGEPAVKNGCTLAAYIGAGSVGLAVLESGKIVYFQNIPIGALKLHDVMGSLRRGAEDFHYILEEYMDTVLGRMNLSGFPIRSLVLTGTQIKLIAKLCGGKQVGPVFHIDVQKLKGLYDSVRAMTAEGIALRYGITEDRAALLYTALFIYRGMIRFSPDVQEILSPPVDLTQAVIRYMLSPKADSEWSAFLRENALGCAETVAGAFHCDINHSRLVGEYAVKLFDKLKKVHGLEPPKRLILELAAALHSCGSFVSARQHSRCTFDIIRGMDIFGLSSEEVLEVALVAGSIPSDLNDPAFTSLSTREQIVVSKLSAIFQLANAMDKSHLEKLKNVKMSLEDDRVLIKAQSSANTLLERWDFEYAARFFKDVFGLSPELSVKFDMI
nr:hypothetical protein [uncultured Acetatifactor sp.]